MVKSDSDRSWIREVDDLKYRISVLEKKKADKTTLDVKFESVDEKFEGVEKMQDDTKSLALRAEKKAEEPHPTIERITGDIKDLKDDVKGVKSDIKELHTKVSKRSTVQLGGVVALIVALVGGASFIFKLTFNVEGNTRSIKTLTDSVQEVGDSNREITATVQAIKLNGEREEKERLNNIRNMFEDVIEAKIDIKPKRKKK